MPEKYNEDEYKTGRKLMDVMVATSQKPEEGNEVFVEAVGNLLSDLGVHTSTVQDPTHSDRSLLVVEVGNPRGEQALAAISHSDVVGVDSQDWKTHPWKLHEEKDTWFGRGVCDTHGSGVSMVLAALRSQTKEQLDETGKRVSIIFTYDEEATSSEFSMRGARLAAGLLEVPSVVTGDYFIAGEPTEIDGKITPMRGHKGRWLSNFNVKVAHSGHVSEIVQNALMSGASIVNEIGVYASRLTSESSVDKDAEFYNPPHSTVQVSAADIKKGDFSTTPSHVRFTVDMRTLPAMHELRIQELINLILNTELGPNTTVELEIIKDAKGSLTPAESLIVKVAEEATAQQSRGFNGGDEGRIMRLQAGKEGVTIGPGELHFAHMPDEQIKIKSIFNAADIYSDIFVTIAQQEEEHTQ